MRFVAGNLTSVHLIGFQHYVGSRYFDYYSISVHWLYHL